jgi:acyl-[acyl-carrier-protein]-phospholipid O-acyltransferase/long-chain-fatty-acid--[acyl-carrier-protein] ligase
VFELLLHKNFASLNVIQFLGAFNDNVLRQVFLLLTVGAGAYDLQATATVVFAIPYLVFSAAAGQLADNFSKRNVVMLSRLAELLVMILATVGIYWKSFPILLISLFLMSAQSTFFSPAKYGILPEILSYDQLSRGNGIIQMFTYAAILIGTAAAGFLLQILEDYYWMIGLVLIVSSFFSIVFSFLLDKLPAADPDQDITYNPLRRLTGSLSWIRKDKYLFLTMGANAFGWFLGTVLTVNINVYGMGTLGLQEGWTSLFMVVLGSGIAAGCLLAGYISGDRIEPGLIPVGAVGMGFSLLALFWVPESYLTNLLYLTSAGVFSGLFFIPILATLQGRPPAERRGEVLGTTNFFTFSGVSVAAAGYVLMVGPAAFSAPAIMGLLGLISIGVGMVAMLAVPVYFLRFVFRVIFRLFYRIKFQGIENVPKETGALFISNHVSYLDGFIISVCFGRPVRFLAHKMFFAIPVVGWFLRLMKIIPISPSPGKVKKALKEARRALAQGDYVCIFPEGAITRTGQILGINRGPEALARKLDVPVIPIYLENVWGSIFSFKGGKFFWKWPENIFSSITVHFGEPLASEPDAERIRVALQELEAGMLRDKICKSNHRRLMLKKLRNRPFTTAVRDLDTSQKYSGFSLLFKTLGLAARLKKRNVSPESTVAVLLPPGFKALVVNLALFFNNTTVLNIDTDMDSESVARLLQENSIQTVIVARKQDAGFDDLPNCDRLVVEKVMEDVNIMDQSKAILQLCCPFSFKSPTTSPPASFVLAGELKQYEMDSFAASAWGLEKLCSRYPQAKIKAEISFSCSEGYFSNFFWPLWSGREFLTGNKAVKFQENCIIPVLSEAKDCFRDCSPELICLTFVFSDPESRPGQTVSPNKNHYLLPGWRLKDTPGFISLNVPHLKGGVGDADQIGMKSGSFGRALPGLALKVVGIESGEFLPEGQFGRIMLRGLSLQKEGWQETGYFGKTDEDGFIYVGRDACPTIERLKNYF